MAQSFLLYCEERMGRRSNLAKSRSFEMATPRIEMATHHISVVLATAKPRSAFTRNDRHQVVRYTLITDD